MKFYYIAASTLLIIFTSSFHLWAQETSLRTRIIRNLPADPEPSKDRYTLFQLHSGQIVPDSLFQTDTWDLGFKGSTIIINGGTNRTGKAGLAIIDQGFDAVDEIPITTHFTIDTSDEKLALPKGSGNGWYNYHFLSHEIRPIPNRTLLVRTATGQFAKVEILNYYRDLEEDTKQPGRYYTFRYSLQTNGEKNFK